MTLRQLIEQIGQYPMETLVIFAALPVVAWILGRSHRIGKGTDSPWKYGYASLVFLACVPGVFAIVLSAYTLFFTNRDLFDLDLTVFFVPPLSMILTLVIVKRNVRLDRIPGFDQLSGLMIVIAVSFAIALAVTKTRIWLVFGSTLATLFLIAAGAFVVLSWAAKRMSGSPDFNRRTKP